MEGTKMEGTKMVHQWLPSQSADLKFAKETLAAARQNEKWVWESANFRMAIWNLVLQRLFGKLSSNPQGRITQDYHVFMALQKSFFLLPMDEIERNLDERKEFFRDFVFAQNAEDLQRFCVFCLKKMTPGDAEEFSSDLNLILESHELPTRVKGSLFVRFHSDKSLLDALLTLQKLEAVSFSLAHNKIEAALEALIQENFPAALKLLKEACEEGVRYVTLHKKGEMSSSPECLQSFEIWAAGFNETSPGSRSLFLLQVFSKAFAEAHTICLSTNVATLTRSQVENTVSMGLLFLDALANFGIEQKWLQEKPKPLRHESFDDPWSENSVPWKSK
jgi:hypothetical protein